MRYPKVRLYFASFHHESPILGTSRKDYDFKLLRLDVGSYGWDVKSVGASERWKYSNVTRHGVHVSYIATTICPHK